MSAFEATFNEIERLGMLRLVADPALECRVLDYRRGLYVSIPADPYCGWIQDGAPDRPRLAFDDLATSDLEDFLARSRLAGVLPRRVTIAFAADGHIARGDFSNDPCREYLFRPEWSSLPRPNPGEDITPVNASWITISYCRQ